MENVQANIAELVKKISTYSWVDAEDKALLQDFLSVSDADAEKMYAILQNLDSNLDEIEKQALLSEKKLFDDALPTLNTLISKGQALEREAQESADGVTSVQTQQSLLQELNSL